MTSNALVPRVLSPTPALTNELLILGLGVALLSLLAQVSFVLPWTPVPITGQTFGVAFVALTWGSRRGALCFALYFLLGGLGLPIFALGKAGLLLGPTLGYLVGMVLATFVVGKLADIGATKTFWTSLGAAYVGSAIIFTCGLINLSYYIPGEALLAAGLWPFLLGDLIKNSLAAGLASKLRQKIA